ncbi:hypothetical protein [Streptomyces sp. NPDC091383]|uniref:hypothetical protein n=1 Tax=Streptomyces sp. NPDC091383 TaxID=3365996 RepID=UPI0037F3589C
MPEAYPNLVAGQRITASLLRSMQPQVARKTADTSMQATTTLALDPHIQFTAEANSVYVFEGWLAYDSDIAADILVGFTTPSGTKGKWTGYGTGTTVISGTSGNATQQNAVSTWGYTVRVEYTDITATRTFGGLNVGNPESILLQGTCRFGPTGGTWGLSWAQAASTATNTTIFTDSQIKAQRIA